MWVSFQHRKSQRVRKFQLSPTNMELTRKDSEGIWDRIDALKEPKRKLAGFAILRADPKTKLLQWATFDADGKDFKEYPSAQPLLFPAEAGRLPPGARVELHLPED